MHLKRLLQFNSSSNHKQKNSGKIYFLDCGWTLQKLINWRLRQAQQPKKIRKIGPHFFFFLSFQQDERYTETSCTSVPSVRHSYPTDWFALQNRCNLGAATTTTRVCTYWICKLKSFINHTWVMKVRRAPGNNPVVAPKQRTEPSSKEALRSEDLFLPLAQSLVKIDLYELFMTPILWQRARVWRVRNAHMITLLPLSGESKMLSRA